MKSFAGAALFAFCALLPVSAQTTATRTVYILPMMGGLDQYLASWITRDGVMQVVADPKAASTVLTDRLGEEFEKKMSQVHPREEDDDEATDSPHAFRSSGSRGTLFLVDAATRKVLWSDYEKPTRGMSAAKVSREARRMVKKLKMSFLK